MSAADYTLESASLRTLLGDVFAVDGQTTALAGERDLNFAVRGAGEDQRLLKVMHADTAPQTVELQVAVLEHLAASAPDLPVQRVVRTREGTAVATVTLDGTRRQVWMLTYLPGELWVHAAPRDLALPGELGESLARLDRALAGFVHPAAHRTLKWDLRRPLWIEAHLDAVREPGGASLVEAVIAVWRRWVEPRADGLRQQVIHNDANDYNLLVQADGEGRLHLSGILDFGDALHTSRVNELAIAGAYACLHRADPLAALCALAAGYHRALPLDEDELAVLFPLLRMRLAVSVVNAAVEKGLRPDDPYVTVSEAPAWATLRALHGVEPALALARLRHACGLEPAGRHTDTLHWMLAQRGRFAPLLGEQAALGRAVPVDLSVGSWLTAGDEDDLDATTLGARIDDWLRACGHPVGIGFHGEARPVYTAPAFRRGAEPTDDRRTIHLGVDVFAPAGTPVHAPLAGEVVAALQRPGLQDYGHVVVLRHEPAGLEPFWTLYGHLDAASVAKLSPGRRIEAGGFVARMGAPSENGGWPPHVHFQLLLAALEDPADAPGVAYPAEAGAFRAAFPNPAALLNLPDDRVAAPDPGGPALAARRARAMGPSLRLSYREPVHLRRGWMQYLYDAEGQVYLDGYNNVPHVGHCNPRVVAAVARQASVLNTNTRYLHELPVAYAEALAGRLPAPLSVCYFVNAASEANELALRLARAATGARDMVVMEHAYHGHTTGLIDISPYKFARPGGHGAPDWVHVSPMPDTYRGPFRGEDAGVRYAAAVAGVIDELRGRGRALAGYICEVMPSVGGQIVPPPGFLAGVYAAVHAAGGVCIADEVQTGFGRTGDHFWAFECQGVVPDIVVMGKPMGNGHPLAAVVTTPAIAAAFDIGMEFFSTFGGNPVSCAAGMAVLQELDERDLQAHAGRVGGLLLEGMRELASRYPIVGDVRGAGLFLGMELVEDRQTRTPATRAAGYVKNRLREERILVGTDGPDDNVLKIRPPMVFDAGDATRLLETLERLLREPALRR